MSYFTLRDSINAPLTEEVRAFLSPFFDNKSTESLLVGLVLKVFISSETRCVLHTDDDIYRLADWCGIKVTKQLVSAVVGQIEEHFFTEQPNELYIFMGIEPEPKVIVRKLSA